MDKVNKNDEVSQGGFILSKIHKLSMRIFGKILKEYDMEINPGQGRILFVLWQEDRIPIQDLAQKTSLTMSTLTSMLDRMKSAELLERIPKPDDRRSYLIVLQPKAVEMKQKFFEISQKMTQIYYADVNLKDQAKFEEICEKILKNLEKYPN